MRFGACDNTDNVGSVWNDGVCSFYHSELPVCLNRRRLPALVLQYANSSVAFQVNLRHFGCLNELIRCRDVQLNPGPVTTVRQHLDLSVFSSKISASIWLNGSDGDSWSFVSGLARFQDVLMANSDAIDTNIFPCSI